MSIQDLCPFLNQVVYFVVVEHLNILCSRKYTKFLTPVFLLTISGAKYSLLAHTTLSLESAEDSFKTHNLSVNGNGKYSIYFTYYTCYVNMCHESNNC